MLDLAKNYNKVSIFSRRNIRTNVFSYHFKEYFKLLLLSQALEEEEKMTPEQLAIKNVGKQDPKRHLEEKVDHLMSSNIVQCHGAMADATAFK